VSTIPVIDVAALHEGSPAAMRVLAAAIGAAARDTGFFVIRNHGIDPDVTARMFAAATDFFDLPAMEKDRVAKGRSTTKVGYIRIGGEAADPTLPADRKESFQIMRELAADDPDLLAGKPFVERNVWPALPGFRNALTAYFEAAHVVAIALHRIFALDVGTDPEQFVRHFERPLSALSILHYPPARAEDEGRRYGVAPHTDFGGFTLLAQDGTAGLEVQRRDGSWIPVQPASGTLVCNVGDALMRWTNDVYVSNPHRVVNRATHGRYSAAFFCDPNGDTTIAPMPSCVSVDRPAKYAPITYAELVRLRHEGTFLDPKPDRS
jgi:isopenicillin N synthase-like dioxygenase